MFHVKHAAGTTAAVEIMPTDDAGRVAIVTGAAHGIGAAIARHLARRGWRIAGADLDDGDAVAAVAARRALWRSHAMSAARPTWSTSLP